MEPDFIKDVNFFATAFYKAFVIGNGDIIISGIVLLMFGWDNYSTFGRKNISSDSSAYFKYVDTGEEITPALNKERNCFTIYAKPYRPIIFSARMITE